jgi:hypothetical protein
MRFTEAPSRTLSGAPSWTAGEKFVATTKPHAFQQFFKHYRLRVKRDDCCDPIIRGKFGHLYDHAADLIGLVLEDTRDGIALPDPSSLVGTRHSRLVFGCTRPGMLRRSCCSK